MKPVAVAMFNTVCAAVVVASMILFAPNAIERVLVTLELNIPVVRLAPKVSVPAVSVYVPVAVNAYAVLNVTAPAVCVNAGVAPSTAVPPYVKPPEVTTKLVEVFIVHELKLNVGPFTVNVVHVTVPETVSVPANNVMAAVVFELPVKVPVPCMFKINAV